MAIALVTSLGEAPGASGGTTSAINTTGATLLIACVSFYAEGAEATLSDSKGNTWVGLTVQGSPAGFPLSVAKEHMYYVAAPSVGSGHTFTIGGGFTAPVVTVLAFSGTHATPLDQQTGNASNTTLTLATGSITPSTDNCVVVVGFVAGDNGGTLSIDGSYTLAHNVAPVGGVNQCGAIAYNIQTTAAATNRTWTQGNGPACATTIASFKAAAAAAAASSSLLLLGVRRGVIIG